jgi:aminoglycoside phosphotransferase (APT) family kinase protein
MTASLDIEQHDALLAYLRGAGHLRQGESASFATLPGGVSSRTVLVQQSDGRDWVIKQSLPQLRVAVEWHSDPARIHHEALGMRWLGRIAPPGTIPRLIFEDREHHLLAMEAVRQPHCNWKALLMRGEIRPDHVRQFGELLGTIHRQSAERRHEVARLFDDRSVFESLRVEPYYAYTASQVPASQPFMAHLIETVRSRRQTVVHGDYSPKNILVHGARLVLLDHEVIHFGDPAFDLGFSLAHFLSKAHHIDSRRAEFTVAAVQYWDAYRASVGSPPWAADLEGHAVRNTLGCLLARVAGRSPLEYLTDRERGCQREAVVALMHEIPSSVAGLAAAFSDAL